MKKIVLLFLLFYCCRGFGQQLKRDALQNALKNATRDSTKIKIYAELSEICELNEISSYANKAIVLCDKNLRQNDENKNFYLKLKAKAINNLGYLASQQGDQKKALAYARQSLTIQEEINDKTGIANSLNNIGAMYNVQGKLDTALLFYKKSLKLKEEIGDKEGISVSLNNLGIIYFNQGDIQRALDYYNQSLKIKEIINDKAGMAQSFSNLGLIYLAQDDLTKALEFFKKSLVLHEKVNDKEGIARSLNNIGSIYRGVADSLKALSFYKRSLVINQEINDKRGIASAYTNIGAVYRNQNNLEKSLDYYSKSLGIQKEINDRVGMAISLFKIADVMLMQKKLPEAIQYAEQSLQLSKEIGYPDNIRDAARLLSIIYSQTGNYHTAYNMHVLYKQMEDSTLNEKNRRASIQRSFQYTYEKKAAQDSIRAAEEKKISVLQLKQEKNQRYLLYGVLTLTALFGIFMFNRFRVTQKQKAIIEAQKQLVEEKQTEVMDSIRYAKRIQQSLLPTEKYIAKFLPGQKSNKSDN